MRGRIVLFVALAVLTALVGAYAGWSTSTPKAAAEAPPSDPSVGAIPAADPAPSGSPAVPRPKARTAPASAPNAYPSAKAPATPASPAKAVPPKAGAAGGATQSGHKPGAPSTPQPPRPAEPVRFGPVVGSGWGSVTDVAPSDRRALTTTFSDFQVDVGNGESAQPDATRSFSMTLPLTDGAKGEMLRVYFQGFALVGQGATARLTVRGNGQVRVRNFPVGWDDSFLQTLELPAIPATTDHLSATIEVHQAPGSEGTAYLNVAAIDASIG
jgi:hypothetical protein